MELQEINETFIKEKYSSLRLNIARKLKSVDIEEFKFFLEDIFDPEDISDIISKSDNVLGIFRQITKHHLWKYDDIAKLISIVNKFIKDDKIKNDIDDYQGSLVDYKAGTKIWQQKHFDCLQQDSDGEEDCAKDEISRSLEERDPSHYKISVRKELIVTLLKREGDGIINVSDYSLKYLDEFFKLLKTKFKLTLGAVLKKVAKDSIEVTWYIPSISAQKILDGINEAVEFLREEHISTMILEGVLIYSGSIGVVGLKVT